MLEILKKFVGDRTDDEALNLIEDVKDSMEVGTDGEDWKAKYDELDKTWREKYKARFFEGTEKPNEKGTEKTDEEEHEEKVDGIELGDLFEGGKING